MKYIEGWGQGTNKVMSTYMKNGNLESEFSYMSSGFLVTFRPNGYTKRVDIQALELDDVDTRIIHAIIGDPST